MFDYPTQAEVSRVLPKNKIYAHAKANNALQRAFIEEVEKIEWRYKLASETINLSPRHGIHEIQVFEIQLRKPQLRENVLRAIDSTIRHPIAFQLVHSSRMQCAMTAKRKNAADPSKWVLGEYFRTEWHAESHPPLSSLPPVLDLHALYEQILRQHLPYPPKENETLPEHMERISRIKHLQRDAEQLQSKILKEKQFNRKVELNQQLKSLNSELERLTNET